MNYKRVIYTLFIFFSFSFFIYTVRLNIENVVKNSGWFNLEKVDIQGLKHINKETVLNKLPFTKTTNIFSLDTTALKKKIEEDTRLKVVKIKTSFPNELIISLKEIYGDYIVLLDNKDYFDVSKQMRIISKNNEILDYDKIVFSISSDFLKTVNVRLDKRIMKVKKEEMKETPEDIIENSFFLKNLFVELDSLDEKERDFLEVISTIYFNPKSYAEIYMRNREQKILIDGSFRFKDIRRARYAYIYSEQLKRPTKAIDVRNGFVKYIF